ncbi:MAPEG family protein [Cardiobacteriaceae bacterium TAE3-ERU3]|nr:MAPEG family protein [Cardiobacteriaceae bacterium TAE3-ERU3]
MIFANWCVLIAMFLPWLCAVYGKYKGGGLTMKANHDPRGFFARAEGVVARANAAQQNSYEIFAPFAFVVLLAQFSGNASLGTTNLFAGLFLLSRFVYILCYIKDLAMLRSTVWGFGMVCILILFFSAL